MEGKKKKKKSCLVWPQKKKKKKVKGRWMAAFVCWKIGLVEAILLRPEDKQREGDLELRAQACGSRILGASSDCRVVSSLVIGRATWQTARE